MDSIGVCISSYDEGALLEGALNSACGVLDGSVCLLEGPVAGAGEPKQLPRTITEALDGEGDHLAAVRTYKDDADKRNAGLRWARHHEIDWLVWLDGDEVLLWPEYLRDWIGRAGAETGIGGFPIRFVELDGSVVFANNRIVKVSAVRKYLLAASQVELHNGMVISLPNEKLCGAGGIPWGNVPKFAGTDNYATPGSDEMELWLGRHRPPVHGEPHILHRSLLRDPKRRVERQHVPEAEWFNVAPGEQAARLGDELR